MDVDGVGVGVGFGVGGVGANSPKPAKTAASFHRRVLRDGAELWLASAVNHGSPTAFRSSAFWGLALADALFEVEQSAAHGFTRSSVRRARSHAHVIVG